MVVVVRFDELEDFGKKEWLTVKPCLFHLYHPMVVTKDKEGIRFECPSNRDYFRLDNGEVKEIYADETAYLRRDVEVKEVENYLKNLKVFNLQDLVEELQNILSEVVSQFNLPYKVKYGIEPDSYYSFRMTIEFSYDSITKNYEDRIYLSWTSRGVYIKLTTHDMRPLYLTSRQFKERLVRDFRDIISGYIDYFVCAYEEMKRSERFKVLMEKVKKETGVNIERQWADTYYEGRIGDIGVSVSPGIINIKMEVLKNPDKLKKILKALVE